MRTSNGIDSDMAIFRSLVDSGVLDETEIERVRASAIARDVEAEKLLRYESGVTGRKLLETLSEHYGCPWVEYDERAPVPPELLANLDKEKLCVSRWFPVARDGDTVIVATPNPRDPQVIAEAKAMLPAAYNCEFRVALNSDIQAFIQEFLHADPSHLLGNERTGLAYWRNTMARWRTRLACYRTTFALARTYLSVLRWGLGLITIGRTMVRLRPGPPRVHVYWDLAFAGCIFVLLAVISYFRFKKTIVHPPKHQTLVEATTATLYFLEQYQFKEQRPMDAPIRDTMLARLADLLPNSCVFMDSSMDNKVRSHLAHERNSLAAQRTVAGCYRTIYSRARTGLSFIRTGVAFASIGLGFIDYFGLSLLTIFDSLLIAAGMGMIVDGALWYWPIRKEQCEASKCSILI